MAAPITPEQRIKNREKDDRWRAAHPDARRASNKRWQQDNPEKVREAQRNWRRANREKRGLPAVPARAYRLTPEEKAERKRERERRREAKLRATDLEKAREKYRRKAAKWRAAHPEESRARNKEWLDKNKERVNQQSAVYRAGRAEEISANKRQYYQAHRDEKLEYSRQYAAANPEKRTAHRKAFQTRPSSRMLLLISGAKYRAKKRGLEFDGLSDLSGVIPTQCACCNQALDYSGAKRRHSPSLDRVDNAGGYVTSNVQVICLRCNLLKKNATITELEGIIAYMRRHLPAC